MAERKPAKKDTQKSAKSTAAPGKSSKGFTDEERAAMRERAQELKAAARRGRRADKADGENDVLAKIAEMQRPDRAMAERLHAIIKVNAPALSPKTWYGMPAYAKDGNVVCFFHLDAEERRRLGSSDSHPFRGGADSRARRKRGQRASRRERAEGRVSPTSRRHRDDHDAVPRLRRHVLGALPQHRARGQTRCCCDGRSTTTVRRSCVRCRRRFRGRRASRSRLRPRFFRPRSDDVWSARRKRVTWCEKRAVT